MFQIAMIEDEEHTRQEVERLISREFEKLKVQDITTEIYKTAEEFLEVKKHYDVRNTRQISFCSAFKILPKSIPLFPGRSISEITTS